MLPQKLNLILPIMKKKKKEEEEKGKKFKATTKITKTEHVQF